MIPLYMAKILKFGTSEQYLNGPTPARKYIPEWYKKIDRFVGKKQIFNSYENGGKTLKLCVPFIDALTTGYIVELWQDAQVTINSSGTQNIFWGAEPAVAEKRPNIILGDFPIPYGYSEQSFAWKFPFSLKTPKGYSLMACHPVNRYDLPFITLTGVVDSDIAMSPGNLPFFIKKDFEGIIPKGTPIVQIFPFKRDDWKSQEDMSLVEEGKKETLLALRLAFGYYKSYVWKKKTYN
jgi:hypothetical protein